MIPGGMGGGASGAGLDEPFLPQLLRRPPRAEPGFHFLPHTLIPPPPPPQPTPPAAPPLVKDRIATVRVPIPRCLPPGPWEPLEISPPRLADPRRSHDCGSPPGNAGDQNAPLRSNFRCNHHPQQQNWVCASRMHDYRRNSWYWGRPERFTANDRAGYGKGNSGANGCVDLRFSDRRNAHGGPAECSRMQNTHVVRYQYRKKSMDLGDYRHSISRKPKTIEQRRPQRSELKQKVKVEWVAVTRRQDEKQNLEVGDNCHQEVKDGDVLQTEAFNHLDQIECAPEFNKLQIDESDVDEPLDGLLPEGFEDGSSFKAELENEEEMEYFSSEGGASREDALPGAVSNLT